MTWFLIALVLLIAFGPVLWLVPSKKDKRVAALRAKARSEGLLVEIRRLPVRDPTPEQRVSAGGMVRDPKLECAAYGRMFRRKSRYLPGWRLIRAAADRGPDPFPDWQFDLRPKGEGRAHLEAMLAVVGPRLASLPADAVALEVDGRSAFVYWRERPGSTVEEVAGIAGILGEIESELLALDQRAAPGADQADS